MHAETRGEGKMKVVAAEECPEGVEVDGGLASAPATDNASDSLRDSGEVSSPLWACFWQTEVGGGGCTR